MDTRARLSRALSAPVLFCRHANRLYHRRLGRRQYNEAGVDPFDADWDTLVVLDACRYDMFERQSDLPGRLERRQSRASTTVEFLRATVDGRDLLDTVYVTANPQLYQHRAEIDADFAAVVDVWSGEGWDDDHGTVPAAAVTDRAVAAARERDPDRLVVHYMQPHHPFVADPLDGDAGLARTGSHSNTANPWVALRRGELSTERVWDAYEATLRHVLEAVATLLDNVEGRVAVTADHGNLFGEWGLYGHPMYTPVPALLSVPWAETTGTDRGTLTPSLDPPEALPVSRVYGDDGVGDRLDALGYR